MGADRRVVARPGKPGNPDGQNLDFRPSKSARPQSATLLALTKALRRAKTFRCERVANWLPCMSRSWRCCYARFCPRAGCRRRSPAPTLRPSSSAPSTARYTHPRNMRPRMITRARPASSRPQRICPRPERIRPYRHRSRLGARSISHQVSRQFRSHRTGAPTLHAHHLLSSEVEPPARKRMSFLQMGNP